MALPNGAQPSGSGPPYGPDNPAPPPPGIPPGELLTLVPLAKTDTNAPTAVVSHEANNPNSRPESEVVPNKRKGKKKKEKPKNRKVDSYRPDVDGASDRDGFQGRRDGDGERGGQRGENGASNEHNGQQVRSQDHHPRDDRCQRRTVGERRIDGGSGRDGSSREERPGAARGRSRSPRPLSYPSSRYVEEPEYRPRSYYRSPARSPARSRLELYAKRDDDRGSSRYRERSPLPRHRSRSPPHAQEYKYEFEKRHSYSHRYDNFRNARPDQPAAKRPPSPLGKREARVSSSSIPATAVGLGKYTKLVAAYYSMDRALNSENDTFPKFVNGDGKVNPSAYGSTNDHDLGLCYGTFKTRYPCELGQKCPWRHHPLSKKEKDWIKDIAGVRGWEFLESIQTAWDIPDIPTPGASMMGVVMREEGRDMLPSIVRYDTVNGQRRSSSPHTKGGY